MAPSWEVHWVFTEGRVEVDPLCAALIPSGSDKSAEPDDSRQLMTRMMMVRMRMVRMVQSPLRI